MDYPVIIQSPDDWKCIHLLGENAKQMQTKLDEELEGTKYCIIAQDSESPNYTKPMGQTLDVARISWEREMWTPVEKAKCQLVVEAEHRNKDDKTMQNERVQYLVVPGHLVLNSKQKKSHTRDSQMQRLREAMEMNTTSIRYTVMVGGDKVNVDVHHPPLLGYRYWYNPKEKEPNAVAPGHSTGLTNGHMAVATNYPQPIQRSHGNSHSQQSSQPCEGSDEDEGIDEHPMHKSRSHCPRESCEISEGQLCPHMILNDIALLYVPEEDARCILDRSRSCSTPWTD